MCLKKVLTVIIFILFYQTHLYSKSNSFNNFNQKNLSNYFSGIVAFEIKKNFKHKDKHEKNDEQNHEKIKQFHFDIEIIHNGIVLYLQK